MLVRLLLAMRLFRKDALASVFVKQLVAIFLNLIITLLLAKSPNLQSYFDQLSKNCNVVHRCDASKATRVCVNKFAIDAK